MANIIKAAECVREAVVVGKPRARRFRPTEYQGGGKPPAEPTEQAALVDLETAMASAKRIVAEAESEADAIRTDAAARGYQEGLARGLAESREQWREQLRRVTDLAERAVVDRESLIRSAERQLVELALAIAAKIIHREATCDETVVLSTVRAAIERLSATDQVRILVNAEDLAIVEEGMAEVAAAGLGFEYEVVADERVQRGGCILETKAAVIDARIETQLARLTSTFEMEQCLP